MPLVGYVVTDLITRLPAHVRRDELESAGYEALVRCAASYDPSVGTSFAQYARHPGPRRGASTSCGPRTGPAAAPAGPSAGWPAPRTGSPRALGRHPPGTSSPPSWARRAPSCPHPRAGPARRGAQPQRPRRRQRRRPGDQPALRGDRPGGAGHRRRAEPDAARRRRGSARAAAPVVVPGLLPRREADGRDRRRDGRQRVAHLADAGPGARAAARRPQPSPRRAPSRLRRPSRPASPPAAARSTTPGSRPCPVSRRRDSAPRTASTPAAAARLFTATSPRSA